MSVCVCSRPFGSMYIEWPTEPGAYTANHQFYVGSQIIAAPISNILPEGVNTTTKGAHTRLQIPTHAHRTGAHA